MKVLLINGSPHAKGCTYTALCEVAEALNKEGIETEIFQVGTKPISGCLGCGACMKTGRCVISDTVNEFLDLAEQADGFVFGSPVHFASASGMLTSFMDRAFYGRGNLFAYKPAAAIMSVAVAVLPQHLNRLTNILPSAICLLSVPSTGTWCTATHRTK